MGIWTNYAKGIDPSIADSSWVRPLHAAIEGTPLQAALEKSGELDAYVLVKVDEMLKSVRTMVDQGMDEQVAKEIALGEMIDSIGHPDPIAEDYELEGAAEDDAAALEDYLGL